MIFYHAMENIGKYVSFSVTKSKRTAYIEVIGKTLKENGVDEVVKMLEKIPRKSKTKEEKYQTLLTYISHNRGEWITLNT
ncbi:MAG: hypothetical protein IPN86_04600 [Saprospiraceae bacterium]|nr:hypothetical protein [Saprospiraceae bacterium]